MIDRVQVSALVFIPLTTVAISLWLAGEPLSWNWLKSFGSSVSATVGALVLFDRWVWKFRLLQGWFVKRPILVGDWKLNIESLWVDAQTKNTPNPIEAKATIRQTYTKLHLHLETSESSGDFISSRIISKDDGTYQITGIFRNQPRISKQDSSRTHLGAVILDVLGEPSSPNKFKGHYWTDRGTSGEIQGSRI